MSALPHVVAHPAPLEDAARDLYERHRGRIFGFCVSQLRSREEAEDAVQDTFIYALRGLRRGVTPEFESAWLTTIARNVCYTRLRSTTRRQRVVVTRDLHAIEGGISAPDRPTEELIGLPEALACIPPTQRRAILLREWQGLSYNEIAEELGLTRGAVETLIFRARRSLARAMENVGQRSVRAANLASLAGWFRSLMDGGAAAKVAAASLVAVGTIAATPPVKHLLVPQAPVVPARTAPVTGVTRPAAVAQAAATAQPRGKRAVTRGRNAARPFVAPPSGAQRLRDTPAATAPTATAPTAPPVSTSHRVAAQPVPARQAPQAAPPAPPVAGSSPAHAAPPAPPAPPAPTVPVLDAVPLPSPDLGAVAGAVTSTVSAPPVPAVTVPTVQVPTVTVPAVAVSVP